MWDRTGAAVRMVAGWPVQSQQVARRNALVASTELTQRRIEADEADEFVRRHLERPDHSVISGTNPA